MHWLSGWTKSGEEDYIILGVTSWAVSLPTYKETPFEQVCTCKKHGRGRQVRGVWNVAVSQQTFKLCGFRLSWETFPVF